ncbi:hypothetical protein U1Q18_023316, partial [Sarracenia purpurea var. burkii]
MKGSGKNLITCHFHKCELFIPQQSGGEELAILKTSTFDQAHQDAPTHQPHMVVGHIRFPFFADGVASTISASDIDRFRFQFQIPNSVRIRAPASGGVAKGKEKGSEDKGTIEKVLPDAATRDGGLPSSRED